MLRNLDVNVQDNNNNANVKSTAAGGAVKRLGEALKNISNYDNKRKCKEPTAKELRTKESVHDISIASKLSNVVNIASTSSKKVGCKDYAGGKERFSTGKRPLPHAFQELKGCASSDELSLNSFKFTFDKENANDIAALSTYVQDIFDYYQWKEVSFKVIDYMPKHPDITASARAQLVDWLVELQETFEMNHETLYLTVKLFDLFMGCVSGVKRAHVQLIGCTSMLIASKYDERSPPLIDDFVYLTGDAINRDEVIAMERRILQVVNFDLGAPLSYRFLRRFARISKIDMSTLTLARYILETSLMFLNFCRVSGSLIAASCLSLAMRMKHMDPWTPLLQACSSYSREDMEELVYSLNHMVLITRKDKKLKIIYSKYSHEVFYEVALIPCLEDKCKGTSIGPPPKCLMK